MPKKQSATPLLPILIIVVIIIGGLYFLFRPQPETPVIPAAPPQEQSTLPRDQVQADKPARSQPEKQTKEPGQTAEPETGLRRAPMQASLRTPCQEATDKLDAFFSYLDEQEYVRTYQFPQNSKEVISKQLNKLLASPPPINGQPTNGVQTVRNAAHLYRVLGRQNLSFLQKIIDNERDLLEETSSDFYTWFALADQCPNHRYPLRPSLEDLYQYAAFFLQTNGGQAYLGRRENSVRLLGEFYCLVIVDQAAQQDLNSYHIDLAAHLDSLIGQLEETDNLAQKDSYLSTLSALRERIGN